MLFSFEGKSQGTLEFNQVKFLTNVATGTGPQTCCSASTVVLTVPAGKVWKIESSSLKKTSNTSPGFIQGFNTGEGISINDMVLYRATTSTETGIAEKPVWLPAGSYNWLVHHDNVVNYTYTGALSIIEFNIVP